MKQRSDPNQRRREKKPVISSQNTTYHFLTSFLVRALSPYFTWRSVAELSESPCLVSVENYSQSFSIPMVWYVHPLIASVPETASFIFP